QDPGFGQERRSEVGPNPAMPLTGHSHSDAGHMPRQMPGHMPGQLPAEDPREMAARAREDLLRGAHRTGRDLPMDVSGPPKRPWEIIVASALGFFAPFFVLVALLWMAFTGGRTFRLLGWMLREVGDLTDATALSWAGDASTGIATVIVAIGSAVGLVVVAGFTAYAWRLVVGHGRARWVALACLGSAFIVMTPLNPLLISCFLLFGTASVVLAFLPRSSAWFARARRTERSPGPGAGGQDAGGVI